MTTTRAAAIHVHVLYVFLIFTALGCGPSAVVAPSIGVIRGLVRDGRTLSPLSNVRIQAMPASNSVTTDESGMYQVSGLAPGEYIISALHRESHYVSYASVPVRVGDNAITTADLILKAGSSAYKGVIIGTVLDEAGKPIQGARITTEPKTSTETTSNDGSFVIVEAPGTKIVIDVVAPANYARELVAIKTGDTNTFTIVAHPQDPTKGWVYGIVTSKGEPVPDAIVIVNKLNLVDTTDEQGMYRIGNLPEGEHLVSYIRDGFSTRNFTVVANAQIGVSKDVSLSMQTAVPSENLELYLPFDSSIEDRSPRLRSINNRGDGYRFTTDRFNRAYEAIDFSGSTCVVTADDINLTSRPITVGMWFYIDDYHSSLQFMIGKASYQSGDGYYITMYEDDMSFVFVTNSGKNVSRKDFNGGYFERRRWRWFGFSINEDGTGYVTMNAQSTYTITPIEGSTTNHEPFTVGDVPAAANSSSFIGKLDQVVVYHRFMKLEDLARIMETKE